MGSFYLYTKRMGDIVERSNGKFSFEELDGIENRYHLILYLAKIYKSISTVALTALDYRNIYNIMYIICLPDFSSSSIQGDRVKLAKSYTDKVKKCQVVLEELIENLLFTNHYI